jgi:hypothetical protein
MKASVQECLEGFIQDYPVRLFILPKPAEGLTEIKKSKPVILHHEGNHEVRVGAFEIQIAIKYNNMVISHILHSKLWTQSWPKLDILLKQLKRLFAECKLRRIAEGNN